MANYVENKKIKLQYIQKRHEELVLLNAKGNGVNAQQILEFLETIAEAGKDIADVEERSLLSNLMYYWSGIAYHKMGHFPMIPLQPVNVTLVPEGRNKGSGFFGKTRFIIGYKAFAVLVSIVIVLGATFITSLSFERGSPAVITTPSAVPTLPTFAGGLGIFRAPSGDSIGMSDGSFVFDTANDRADRALKLQGAERLRAHDISAALALWQSALAQDTNDAEAAIYLEDQRVLASSRPYITLIVTTTFQQASADNTSREILQGVYVAQKQANDGCNLAQCFQTRLLIANSGSVATYATTIAQQIVQVARADKTLVGVVGWSSSAQTINAIRVLASAGIPLLSQSASSDVLSGISPFFFRIVPPGGQESAVAAKYAVQQLKAKRVALFVDPASASSQSLASGFVQALTNYGGSAVASEYYQTGKVENFNALIQHALLARPDLIYFPGNVDDTLRFLSELPSTGPSGQIPVIGSTTFSAPVRLPINQANISRLYFTAFAFPDQWAVLASADSLPPFFAEYAHTFDPLSQHPGAYDYSRPGTFAMLSYDATITLLQATRTALQAQQNHVSLTADIIAQSLAKISGSQAIQGVTGQISFDAQHNPINKTIVLLHIDAHDHIQMESASGCFLISCSSTNRRS